MALKPRMQIKEKIASGAAIYPSEINPLKPRLSIHLPADHQMVVPESEAIELAREETTLPVQL